MAVEKVETVAYTPEEIAEAGFIGRTYSYPNEFHEASGTAEELRAEVVGIDTTPAVVAASTATAKGAVVNSNDSPKPSGGASGPGANTDTSKDDKK